MNQNRAGAQSFRTIEHRHNASVDHIDHHPLLEDMPKLASKEAYSSKNLINHGTDRKYPMPGRLVENPQFRQEQLLLESDPFTLEQQRYLKRLRNSEFKMKNNYNHYHSSVLLPEIKN